MFLIDAWIDGGSSDPEAQIEIAEYVEDTDKTNLVVTVQGDKHAEIVLDDTAVRQLIRALSGRLARDEQ
jgi:hypothetical protein